MYYVEYRILNMRKNYYKDTTIYKTVIFTGENLIKEKEAMEIIQRSVNIEYDDIDECEEEHSVVIWKFEEIRRAYDSAGNTYYV